MTLYRGAASGGPLDKQHVENRERSFTIKHNGKTGTYNYLPDTKEWIFMGYTEDEVKIKF